MTDSLYVIKNAFSNYPTSSITLKSNLPSFTSTTISLNSLTDIAVTEPADGEVLTYDAAAGKFLNKPITANGGDF